jgi:[protein-PII] uridylyltransferase
LEATPPLDGGIVLRAARAAAENGLPINAATLTRLKVEAAAVEEPWPAEVREDFVALLGAGESAVGVLESLDHAGLLEPLIPEWSKVRSKAQHNPVHTFTVDRHLLETAAQAALLVRGISRPDLLLVSALLHDIGKGWAGDHSKVGAPIAARVAERMGFEERDVAMIRALARHHLLLPDTATRRDPDDPATMRIVLDAVGNDSELLDLLHALSIADAAATGPAAWSDWKGSLIAELVRRVHLVQRGVDAQQESPLDAQRRVLAEAGKVVVLVGEDDVTVAVPDRIGTLYRTAGVLALNLLDIRSASIKSYRGMAVNHFVVAPRFGRMPDAARLREELLRVLDGDTGLAGRLREKEQAYAKPVPAGTPPPTVLWFDDEATDATLVEYRAHDSIGLLCRITAALERCQLDVRGARVSSLAGNVVDSFYVTTRGGGLVPQDVRADIEAELLRA